MEEMNTNLINLEENPTNPEAGLTEINNSDEASISVGKILLVGTAAAAAIYGARKLWKKFKDKKAAEVEQPINDELYEYGDFTEVTEETAER